VIPLDIKPIIKDDFIVLDDETTVSNMFGQLRAQEKRTGLVFRNKKYAGLVEKKKLLRSRLDVTQTKLKKYVQKTPILNENADVIETAYLMFQSNQDFLPVESAKKIVGVVEGLDVVSMALELSELKKQKVNELKFVKSIKVSKDDPVASAIDVMYKERVDQVPIFDKGKLFGVVTYRDLMRKYLNWSPKRDVSAKFNKMASSRSAEADMPHLASLPVSSFSTNDNLVTINRNDTLKRAVKLMEARKVSNILVMDNKDFVGMLTVKNILRMVASLKIPQNFNIKFVGFNKLDVSPSTIKMLKKIASNEAFKIQRLIHNEFTLVIHIKQYEKEAKQHMYSINMRVEYPGQMVSSNQEDWKIETAFHKNFENLKNTLGKKFKGGKKVARFFG
jgi:CBS domain-containing protein